MMADLRNAVVHQRERSYEYLSVPVPSIVENMERIRDKFLTPDRVYPKFKSDVARFQIGDAFMKALQAINEKEYSQFPIYDNNLFKGLLTENGITRWLAHHTIKVMSLVEFGDVLLSDILLEEENRQNFDFIPRGMTMSDAENRFIQNSLLEALLITEGGKQNETPLGIIIRWDTKHL